MKPPRRDSGDIGAYAALSLAALFWSGNFIAGRAIGGQIGPVELNVVRWSLCLLLFLPFCGRRLYLHRGTVWRERKLVVLLGLTGIASFHTMVYQALSLTTAVNALLILAMAPVATVIGGAVWHGVRIGRGQVLGLVASLIGAVVLITRGNILGLADERIDAGKLWMFGAILVWAWYSLLLRRRPADLPQDVTLASSIVVALVALVPLMLVVDHGAVQITPPLIMAVLYIAICASLVGYLCWSYGVTRIGPERAGQFVHLMPVFGSLMAVVLLREELYGSQIAGAAFILVGIVLVSRAPAAAPRPAP